MYNKSEKYIISLDQGTTSSCTILFDSKCNIVNSSQKEFKQVYPKPGWVEHNPSDIWESQLDSFINVIKNSDMELVVLF